MNLFSSGQIQVGDTIICEFKGERKEYKVEEVLNPGKRGEEILLDKRNNLYFITSMSINGTSWAKNVKFLRP